MPRKRVKNSGTCANRALSRWCQRQLQLRHQRPDDDVAWFQEEEVGELLGRREVSPDRNCLFPFWS